MTWVCSCHHLPVAVGSVIKIATCNISVPGILNEAVPATTQNVDSEIQRTVRDAYKYTGLIEKVCYDERTDPPQGLSVQLLKESLINARQHEALLRVLLVSLVLCGNTMCGSETLCNIEPV